MMVYRIDLLGQTGMCECCSDSRPGERMGAVSENATSSDCSHDVRLSFSVVECMRRGRVEIKGRDSHYPKPSKRLFFATNDVTLSRDFTCVRNQPLMDRPITVTSVLQCEANTVTGLAFPQLIKKIKPSWRSLLQVTHVLMGKFNMCPGQRARPAHLSLPSPAVLARQPLECRLPDAVPG